MASAGIHNPDFASIAPFAVMDSGSALTRAPE